MRFISADSSLRDVLAAKIPAEQERVKNFRKQYGATKMGETTIDMVSRGVQKKLLWAQKKKIIVGTKKNY